MKVKLVYRDGDTNKAVRGLLEKEDSDFFYILDNGLQVRISKSTVVSLKECLKNEKE